MSDTNDKAVNDEAAQNTAPEDSATTENNSSNNTDFEQGFDSDDGEYTSQDTDSKSDSKDESDNADETNDSDDTPPEGVGEKAQDRFRSVVNERNTFREQNEQLQQQLAELQAQSELYNQSNNLLEQVNPETGEYYTREDIENASWQANRERQEQQRQAQMQQIQIQQNVNNAVGESTQTLKDFPMFDESSKEYNAELSAQYDELLGEHLFYATPDGQTVTANVLKANNVDPTQFQFLGSNMSPYKLAKLVAGSTHINDARNKAAAQHATESMLANVDGGGGASQSTPSGKDDPFLVGFDSED